MFTVFHEVIIYPLIGHKLPSTLKCIGLVQLLILLVNGGFLIAYTVNLYYSFQIELWFDTLYSIMLGFTTIQLTCLLFELVAAQAPYKMRGLY